MDTLSFRPAGPGDLPFLEELRRTTMTPHELASGVVRTPAQVMDRVLASFEVAQVVLRAG